MWKCDLGGEIDYTLESFSIWLVSMPILRRITEYILFYRIHQVSEYLIHLLFLLLKVSHSLSE